MSWTMSIASIPKDQVEEKFQEALDNTLKAQPFDEWDADVKTQQDEMKKVISELTASGQVGDGPFNIAASGHRKVTPTEQNNIQLSIVSY